MHPSLCPICQTVLASPRSRTCSTRCRQALSRARRAEERRAALEVLARAASLGVDAGPVAVATLARDAARTLADARAARAA